jgi:hypothetical protein
MAARGRITKDTTALEPREADERYDRYGNVVKQPRRAARIERPGKTTPGRARRRLLMRPSGEIVYCPLTPLRLTSPGATRQAPRALRPDAFGFHGRDSLMRGRSDDEPVGRAGCVPAQTPARILGASPVFPELLS